VVRSRYRKFGLPVLLLIEELTQRATEVHRVAQRFGVILNFEF
jgi:hypothetical protein